MTMLFAALATVRVQPAQFGQVYCRLQPPLLPVFSQQHRLPYNGKGFLFDDHAKRKSAGAELLAIGAMAREHELRRLRREITDLAATASSGKR